MIKYSLLCIFGCILLFACKPEPKLPKQLSEEKSEQKTIDKSLPDWAKNASIYEVNLRQFTKEGTFESFIPHIERLDKMGIDILWFMPIYPISETKRKGGLGSPYAVSDYKNTNPEFGSLADFDKMVSAIHKAGMKIILDWVPNHTGWDNAWITAHPDWYTQDSLGNIIDPIDYNTGKSWGWTDVADLNFDKKEMRAEMINCLLFWIKKHDIDGFRMDVAHGVPDKFWSEVSDAVFAAKHVFMLSEGETHSHRNLGNFHMDYGWSFHHLLNDVAKGEKNVKDLRDWYAQDQKNYKSGFHMHFTSNHDENTWAGTVFDRMGEAHKPLAVLTQTFEGMPLIYSGQEEPLKKRLEFFEKDEIGFKNYSYQDFYSKLNALKDKNKALWNGNYGGAPKFISDSEKIMAYEREKNGDRVAVFINLSKSKSQAKITKDINGLKDIETGKEIQFKKGESISLDAWSYIVASSN